MASYEHNENNDNIYFLGGSYDLSGLVLMGFYIHTKLVSVNTAAGITIKAGYGPNQDRGNHKVSFGDSHLLSKRTILHRDFCTREKSKPTRLTHALGMSHTF